MRKIFLFPVMFALLLSSSLFAQDKDTAKKDSPWDYGAISSFTLAQTLLKNWSAGGENSFAYAAFTKAHLNYKKGKHAWSNNLDLAYGSIKQGDKPFRKTDDKIELNSQYGLKAFDNFYYTALLNFKTQFTTGYDYSDNDSVKISNFMAPGYLVYSLGMSYKPNKYFNIYASILSGKTTYVLDPDLSAVGAFGVDSGKTVRRELGAYVKIQYNKEILKNLTLNTKIDLFSNYKHNPQNIDVNADLLVAYKINKFLTFNIKTQMIYDDDMKILVDPETGKTGPRLQIQEIIGLGITYKF